MAYTFVAFRLERRGGVVSMSFDLVADGFGRPGLDRISDGVNRTSPSGVMGQGRVSLLVREMIAGLVLTG